MTEQEAIIWLEDDIKEIKRDLASGEVSNGYAEEGTEIYKMAISALKEIQQYRKIGTVEECREAVEKQKTKKCVEDSCPDHTHYKCPLCGKIQKTKYGDSTFGGILNHCSNCGQALMNENLEENI